MIVFCVSVVIFTVNDNKLIVSDHIFTDSDYKLTDNDQIFTDGDTILYEILIFLKILIFFVNPIKKLVLLHL